ncbi:chemotaxis protein CheW [Undibacterium pigrum]|uniref:Chemotaxis protein CheW n=1 Tax=Undibacterium pigrum TaxID=401470 RepID=A0A318J1Z7_9BURK|nr:chemotaxis protein CheW [Undibacterium pigrum]PXX37948.1 purine-binding chemotaxis protein CheW [Undibacterium pigrum]
MFTNIIPQDTANVNCLSHEFLCFGLGAEEFGIDIHKIQEIRNYEITTTIANTPDYLKGVINLRGIIVPIIDMRIKFKFGQAIYNDFTVVIILHLTDRTVGIVVDRVADVVTLGSSDIRQIQHQDIADAASYLLGIGTLDQRMLILIDIDHLLANELELLTSASIN